MIMYTFFDTYDFSGKTIIPFNTHAGSGNGGTYDTIREWEPNAVVKEGLAIAGSSIENASSKEQVEEWLSDIGLMKDSGADITSPLVTGDGIVTVSGGKVHGTENNGIYQYLGIPYAEAEQRFVPAKSSVSWDGVLETRVSKVVSSMSSKEG